MTFVLTLTCLNHRSSTARRGNPARRSQFSSNPTNRQSLPMSHLLVISKVGSKWCSGQERDPELNIWCGSLKGGEREEERGMSSIRQVSLPRMNVFVIVGHCDPGLCYDDNCHALPPPARRSTADRNPCWKTSTAQETSNAPRIPSIPW